jgi:hypothetical protein
MFTTRIYFPLGQLQPRYDDDLVVEPAMEMRNGLPASLQSVSLFLTANGLPSHLRVTLAATEVEEPPAPSLKDAHNYAGRALNALQLLKWPSLEFFRPAVGIFSFRSTQRAEEPYRCGVEFQEIEQKIDPAVWSNFVNKDEEYQIGLRLLADARNWSLPLPFRFLSYYKLLERAYRVQRVWKPEFDSLLKKYEEKWKALGVSNSSLKVFIHSTRDRCAHIQTGNEDVLGVLSADSTVGARIGRSLGLINEMMNDVPPVGTPIVIERRT